MLLIPASSLQTTWHHNNETLQYGKTITDRMAFSHFILCITDICISVTHQQQPNFLIQPLWVNLHQFTTWPIKIINILVYNTVYIMGSHWSNWHTNDNLSNSIYGTLSTNYVISVDIYGHNFHKYFCEIHQWLEMSIGVIRYRPVLMPRASSSAIRNQWILHLNTLVKNIVLTWKNIHWEFPNTFSRNYGPIIKNQHS